MAELNPEQPEVAYQLVEKLVDSKAHRLGSTVILGEYFTPKDKDNQFPGEHTIAIAKKALLEKTFYKDLHEQILTLLEKPVNDTFSFLPQFIKYLDIFPDLFQDFAWRVEYTSLLLSHEKVHLNQEVSHSVITQLSQKPSFLNIKNYNNLLVLHEAQAIRDSLITTQGEKNIFPEYGLALPAFRFLTAENNLDRRQSFQILNSLQMRNLAMQILFLPDISPESILNNPHGYYEDLNKAIIAILNNPESILELFRLSKVSGHIDSLILEELSTLRSGNSD